MVSADQQTDPSFVLIEGKQMNMLGRSPVPTFKTKNKIKE